MNHKAKSNQQNYPTAMRLAVIFPSFAGGGLERVQLSLIKQWLKQNIEIDIVVSHLDGPLTHLIPSSVSVFEMAHNKSYMFPFGLFRYLKSRNPTHIVSSANDINVMTLFVASLLRIKSPIIITVHNHLSSELQLAEGITLIKLKLITWLLERLIHRAKSVIAVSQGVADDLAHHFTMRPEQLHIVYNPVISPQTYQKLTLPLINCPISQGTPWILYVGRLVQAKGIDVLLDAFKLLAQHTDTHLVLMGAGPLRETIAKQIVETGLSLRIHLIDFQENPLPWMREASVLALPSRHEGLGNVLIEAMACGTQVVATNCPSGPSEILDGGRYGQLVSVDNCEELAEALKRSLKKEFWIDPMLLKKRAEFFTESRAAKKYLSLLTPSETN